jgi:hypothetical protein
MVAIKIFVKRAGGKTKSGRFGPLVRENEWKEVFDNSVNLLLLDLFLTYRIYCPERKHYCGKREW